MSVVDFILSEEEVKEIECNEKVGYYEFIELVGKLSDEKGTDNLTTKQLIYCIDINELNKDCMAKYLKYMDIERRVKLYPLNNIDLDKDITIRINTRYYYSFELFRYPDNKKNRRNKLYIEKNNKEELNYD
jgi:hypothetical protein